MNRIVPIIIAIAIVSAIIRHAGLFPVIVLFMIGISIYRQYKKAAGKTDGQAPQWKKSLDDVLGQIRKELDTGSDPALQTARTEWEKLASGEEPETAPLELEPEEPVRPSPRIREGMASSIPRKKPPVADPPRPVAMADESRAAAPSPALQASRLEELRKAVVWSEILAKPVALRGRQRW